MTGVERAMDRRVLAAPAGFARRWAQWGGPAMSLLCAVHCASLPLLTAALPALGGALHEEWVDWALLGSAALAAAWGVKQQRPRAAIVWLIASGLTLVLMALVRGLESLVHAGFGLVALGQVAAALEAKRRHRCRHGRTRCGSAHRTPAVVRGGVRVSDNETAG